MYCSLLYHTHTSLCSLQRGYCTVVWFTIHLMFVRTKLASNGCKRTLWNRKRVKLSDWCDNNWQLFWQKKPNQQIRYLHALRILSLSFYDLIWLPGLNLRLTLVCPSFAMIVSYGYVHVQISPMLFCVDVLITQYF